MSLKSQNRLRFLLLALLAMAQNARADDAHDKAAKTAERPQFEVAFVLETTS
jgi:hypothetical protein